LSNVSFETSLVQKSDGSILGAFTPKYRYREWGTTVSAEVKTNKDIKAEVAIEDQFTPGLKTSITGEAKGENLLGTFGVEYKHDLAAVTTSVDYGHPNGSTLKASAVVGSQGFSLGADVEYAFGNGSTTDSRLVEFDTTVGYSTTEFDVFATGKLQNDKDANIIQLSYFHRVNPDLQVATDVSFDTANADAKPKLALAAQYKLEADTTLKGKVDTAGKLGLSFQQRFNKNAKFTISSTFDTNNLGAKNSATFGCTLSLS